MKFKKLPGFDRVTKKDMCYQAEMPITMADAVLDSEERANNLNKEFEEQTKVAEEFVKEQEGKKNFKITLKEPVYKKMGLIEHRSQMTKKQLMESFNNVIFQRIKNSLDDIFESIDVSGEEFKECIKRYLDLFETDEDDVDESLKEGYPYDDEPGDKGDYTKSYNWSTAYNQFSAIINKFFPDEEEINRRVDKLYQAHKGEPAWDEAYRRWNDSPTNEAKECPNCGEKDCDGSCEKELTETKHGQKDDDLWTRIYNNLATHLDINEVNREVPDTSKGCRYNEIRTDFDGNIIVYGTKPEEFDFAKKVADHYGVEYDDVKEDKNPKTNSYYKYSMKIKVPMED